MEATTKALLFVLTDLTVLAGSARRAFAHVSSLRQDVAGGAVLAGLADARVQRLLAVATGELRRAYASVIRRLVLLHRIIAVLVIVLIFELVVVVALVGGAVFPRAPLGSFPRVHRGAMAAPAPDDVHPGFVAVATSVPASTSLLQPPALPAVAEILLEDRLARRAVLAGQIGTRVVAALLHAVALEHVLVTTHVEVHVDPVDLQLAYAAEQPVVGADIVVDSIDKFVISLVSLVWSR